MNKKSEWEQLLTSACILQKILPEAVVVGGTEAAIHVGNIISFDHILNNLKENFEDGLLQLNSIGDFELASPRKPVQILGSLDGVETGIRQLRRKVPLEVETVNYKGFDINLPTKEELLRIKVFLCLERNAVRDYLDTIAIIDNIDVNNAYKAIENIDYYYPQETNKSYIVLEQIVRQFSEPLPFDLEKIDVSEYKEIKPPYNDWNYVVQKAIDFSYFIGVKILDGIGTKNGLVDRIKKVRETIASGCSLLPLEKLPGLKK